MNWIARTFVVGLVLLAAGCRTTTQSDKFVALDYAAKPKSMLVAYYLDDDPVILDNRRLEQGVSAGLAKCGVRSRSVLLTGSAYNGYPTEYMTGAYNDIDAVLVVSQGSSRAAKLAEALMGGRRGETGRNYDVALFDRQSASRVWGGEINVHGSGFLVYKPQEKTDNFARDLVGYLAADGLIPTCPKEQG